MGYPVACFLNRCVRFVFMDDVLQKHVRRVIIGCLIVLFGAGVLFYPYGAQIWNNYRNVLITQSYSDFVSTLTEKDLETYWNEARAYNKQHTVNVVEDAFAEDAEYVLSHPYDTMLNPNGDGIMGYIEIPCINVRLAIYHGLSASVLEHGVGHVEGTSLPIGGESTHACLAGHRGLPTGELFTRLNEVEVGDVFYLYVLDAVLTYKVDAVNVVEPEDTSLVQIEEGEDLVTLITCTPYSINTHRLLVRGHRIPTPVEEDIETTTSVATFMAEANWTLIIVGAGVLLVFIIILSLYLTDMSGKEDDED